MWIFDIVVILFPRFSLCCGITREPDTRSRLPPYHTCNYFVARPLSLGKPLLHVVSHPVSSPQNPRTFSSLIERRNAPSGVVYTVSFLIPTPRDTARDQHGRLDLGSQCYRSASQKSFPSTLSSPGGSPTGTRTIEEAHSHHQRRLSLALLHIL